MSWKSDSLSISPHPCRAIFLAAIFCCGVFCCAVDHCQAQIVGVETGSVLGAAAASQTDGPEDSQAVRAQFIEFERQLNAMLKTRRDEEKQFVGQVVNQIRLGLIPSKLVSTSFEWVRNKRPTTKYPFVYFERVLRLQAGRLGLASEIPPFDFSIYSQIPEVSSAVASSSSEASSSDNGGIEPNGGFEPNGVFGFQGGSGLPSDRIGLIGGRSETSAGVSSETEPQSGLFRLFNRVFSR